MPRIIDFSGNDFNTGEQVNVCKMKCELALNETDLVKITKSSNPKGFAIDSNLFTVKYGNKIYSFNKRRTHYVTSNIIHKNIFKGTHGVVSELVFHANDNTGKQLYIHSPIYKSFKSNKNGSILKRISKQGAGQEEYDISEMFPRNISFYTYSNGNETSIVFTTSNIMISESLDLTDLTAITSNFSNSNGIRDTEKEAGNYKFFLNSSGIADGDTEATIIDCQPIDDDGMLLVDREKGLNQTGISQTSSLEVIKEKIMENPLAQSAIGVILLYVLTKIIRSGQIMFNK